MLNFLSQYTILVFNDLAPKLLNVWLNTGSLKYTPQLLGNLILYAFKANFNPFLANNLLILLNIILTLYFSYKLFRLLKFDRSVSGYLSLSYAFSPYFLYRVISVSQLLYFTFVFPLLIYFILKKTAPLKLGVYVALVFYLSNYYGYFCFIFFVFYLFSESLYARTIKPNLTKLLLFILPVLILLIGPNTTYFIRSTPLLGEYTKESLALGSAGDVVPYRALEDFMSYSFRPWYFIIPPTGNIFVGDISKVIYERLEQTQYFLALNYDVQEAGGAFLGYHFIVFFLFTLILTYRKVIKQRHHIFVLTTVFTLILLISSPPFFTISGLKFYTPSYILYHLMPPFRVLVRFSVMLFLINLIIAGYSIQYLVNLVRLKIPGRSSSLALFSTLIVLSLVQFSIKLPIVNFNNPPGYIQYLNELSPEDLSAVYPFNNYESHFWLLSQRIPVYNLTNIASPAESRILEEFTQRLNSIEGLEEAKNKGVTHLVIVKNAIKEEESKFFEGNLQRVKDFDEVIIYKLQY